MFIKKTNKIVFMVIALLSIGILVACGGNNSESNANSNDSSEKSNEDVKTIKIAATYGADHYIIRAYEEVFKPMVEENSEGSLKVEIYPNSELGSEEQYFSAMRSGAVEMGVSGTNMNDVIPQVDVFQLPFLFDSLDQAKKVLDNEEIRELITSNYEEKLGLHFLGFGIAGQRVISSKEPINSMEDLDGLKIRMSAGYDIQIKTGSALGMNVTPMPFDEVFTSLEQGIIDGQENPYSSINHHGLHEVQNYILESFHVTSININQINKDFWDSLTDKEQQVIQDAINASLEHEWENAQEEAESDKQELIENGMEVIVPDEAFKQDLRDATKSVYEWHYEQTPENEKVVKEIEKLKNEM